MQKFGEMCFATIKDNTHLDKLANQQTPDIWVGYAENHPTGTYQIFNPKTKCIILNCDVTFLKKSSQCWKTCDFEYELWWVWWWQGTQNSSHR